MGCDIHINTDIQTYKCYLVVTLGLSIGARIECLAS
jgi:hypothetical protein